MYRRAMSEGLIELVSFAAVITIFALILGFASLGKANPLNERCFVLLHQVFNFAAGTGRDVENQEAMQSLFQTPGS